jgi:hypothetical protein
LNAWMVREGWALAYVQYSSAYVHDEENARAYQRAGFSPPQRTALSAPMMSRRHYGGSCSVVVGRSRRCLSQPLNQPAAETHKSQVDRHDRSGRCVRVRRNRAQDIDT